MIGQRLPAGIFSLFTLPPLQGLRLSSCYTAARTPVRAPCQLYSVRVKGCRSEETGYGRKI